MSIGFNPGAMGLAAHMSPMSPAPNMGMRPPVPPRLV